MYRLCFTVFGYIRFVLSNFESYKRHPLYVNMFIFQGHVSFLMEIGWYYFQIREPIPTFSYQCYNGSRAEKTDIARTRRLEHNSIKFHEHARAGLHHTKVTNNTRTRLTRQECAGPSTNADSCTYWTIIAVVTCAQTLPLRQSHARVDRKTIDLPPTPFGHRKAGLTLEPTTCDFRSYVVGRLHISFPVLDYTRFDHATTCEYLLPAIHSQPTRISVQSRRLRQVCGQCEG